MSIDYSTYVGPYVACLVQRVTTTEARRTCPNPGCANYTTYMQPGFCSHCGSPVADVGLPVIGHAVDDDDLREAIDERLVTPSGDAYTEWSRNNDIHLWLPNVGDIGRHLDSREAFALHRILPNDIYHETHAFEGYFAAELARLRSAYGAAAVSVRWGVVQDYS